MREKKDTRIFFALWPDVAVRAQLGRAAQAIPVERPARRVPVHNIHLTLHFIGNVFHQEMACLQQQARQLRCDAFEFHIDCRGHFGKPRVAWLGCSKIPTALSELHQQLGQRLGECGYQPEARRYNPHVTVARKIGKLSEIDNFEPILWQAREFALIEVCPVDTGVQYRVVETYALT